jgi:hypothetical protein
VLTKKTKRRSGRLPSWYHFILAIPITRFKWSDPTSDTPNLLTPTRHAGRRKGEKKEGRKEERKKKRTDRGDRRKMGKKTGRIGGGRTIKDRTEDGEGH